MTLSKIISSKVRTRIIRQYIFHPNSEYHIRELVRILKDEVNAVRRELINLQRIGFLKSQRQANRIVYSVDSTFYMLEDFRSIWHKEFGLGGQILRNKKQLGEISYALLTYTFLTLSASNISDLDLIIVGEPDERILEAVIQNAEEELKRDIFYTIVSEKEWISRKRRRDPQAMSAILLPHSLLIGDPIKLIE